MAEALADLPRLHEALREGALPWTAVREITRVATPETEAAWLGAAKGRTVREVERMVSGRPRGALPGDPAEPGAQKHTLVLELCAETFALFREARSKIESEVGGRLSDDEAMSMIAREVLAGGGAQGDEASGRAPYQIMMSLCERCDRGFVESGGETYEVEPSVVERARCDAEVIPRPHVGGERSPDEAGCLAPHVGGAAPMETSSHVGNEGGKGGRASQTIPPASRRQARREYRGGCAVPGCRSTKFIEVHHIELRSEGGSNDADNLVPSAARITTGSTAASSRSSGSPVAAGRGAYVSLTPTAKPTEPCLPPRR